MSTTTQATDRTATAILARRQHTAGLICEVHDALQKLRRDRTRITFRGVAARAASPAPFSTRTPTRAA